MPVAILATFGSVIFSRYRLWRSRVTRICVFFFIARSVLLWSVLCELRIISAFFNSVPAFSSIIRTRISGL